MKPKSSTPSDREARSCRALSLREVRKLPRIPSGYRTETVWRVARGAGDVGMRWGLEEVRLPAPLEKIYDTGNIDDWIESYSETVPRRKLRFIGALESGTCSGLATWCHLDWNNSIWLMDIRVRNGRRGHGIGSMLLREVAVAGRRVSARGVMVETQTTNAPAVRFYLKHGFKLAGLNEHLYGDEEETGEVALFLFQSLT